MFETILAPLDGSTLAEQAIPYVNELAAKMDSAVTLMGVCETEESQQGEACRLSIGKQVEQLNKTLSVSRATVKAVVLTGRPAQQIVDFAETNKVGLMVLTSHGRSGLAPWSLGSTVQRILNLRSTVPLLLVKATAGGGKCEGLFGRILLPLDGSARGETAVPYVVELAGKFEMDVILFHVVEEGRHVHSVGGLDYVRFPEQDIAREKAGAEKYLEGVGDRFIGTRAKLIHEVRIGEAAREILKIASEQDRCLIAMASHGHSGIDAWTFGNVTYKVIQSTDKDLFLVRG